MQCNTIKGLFQLYEILTISVDSKFLLSEFDENFRICRYHTNNIRLLDYYRFACQNSN